jgi:hypothetical protein
MERVFPDCGGSMKQQAEHSFPRRLAALVLCLFLLPWRSPLAGEVLHEVDPATGLASWKTQDQAFSLELIQILPDYVRAVYASRGLPQAVIDKVSSYCVFGTIVKNESDAPLAYRVADWRYRTPDGVEHRLRTKSDWVREWREMGIAFRWSMLPDDQTFEVGDWGQGFTTIALPPGSRFDLHYSWRQHDQTHTGKITGLRCAPAQHEAPAS